MSNNSDGDETAPEPQRALTSQDTLLRYKRAKRVLPDKKVIASHYTHVTGMTPLPEEDRLKSTDEILNSIFPPRFYERGGKTFKQEVDREPAYHWDIKDLNKRLNDRLKEMGAEEVYVGLCPVRKLLFEQAFDEILRQVTVNMGERGLLLKRIRDELRLTLNNYHRLYLSATRYAIRKAIVIANQKFELEKSITKLTMLKESLEQNIAELLADEEREEREEAELRETADKAHATECFLLRRKCRILEAQIRTKVVARALKKKAKKKQTVKKYKQKLFKA